MDTFFSSSRLVDYSSDETFSDEEPLTTTTNSTSSNQNGIVEEAQKCGVLLPLPDAIQQMYPEEEEVESDPSNHGGRVRSFPHERGVWATYVYIEYNADPDFFRLVDEFREMALSRGKVTLEVPVDFHISLSRTLRLRHHWIGPFVDALRAKLSCCFRFKLVFQSLEVYENEEKTRTFLGLKVHIGYENLLRLVKKVDHCLDEFKLQRFYENPSFHLSFASCVGSQAEKLETLLADLNFVFQSFINSHSDCRTLDVTQICCKSGNKLFPIKLKT